MTKTDGPSVLADKLVRNANLAAEARDTTASWLESLGTSMCDVWFLQQGHFFLEKHVDDHDTFLETVGMALTRLKARYAMWNQDGAKPWALLDKTTGELRSYPTREAAEMVAIHGG